MLAATAVRTDPDDPLGGLEVGERPDPDPRPDWVRVRLRAASLNHHETVRLLNHGAQHGHRGVEFVFRAQTVIPGRGPVLVDRHGAEGAVAVFELGVGARTGAARSGAGRGVTATAEGRGGGIAPADGDEG
jgi:hypothetical protein